MFFDDTTLDLIARGLILAVLGMVWVVLLIRINGLRSLSKMTNFDFVMTVALGSLLAGASQSTEWSGFAQTMVAMAALFIIQWGTARLRKASNRFEEFTQNTPIILMRNGTFVERALKETRVSQSDVIAKLREANALELSKVRAVVLETTGDVSVLHGDALDEILIENVRSY